jgi:HJR/Mrr/RecB family endonuclease
MLLTSADVDKFERYVHDHVEAEDDDYFPEEGSSVDFFGRRPHLLLPIGFDETRALVDPNSRPTAYTHYGDEDWFMRAAEEAAALERKYGIEAVTYDFGVETIFRSASSGSWQWFEGLDNGELVFSGAARRKYRYPAEQLLAKLRQAVNYPDEFARALWLPRIWSPQYTSGDRRKIGDDVSLLLQNIRAEKQELRAVDAHKLEELVAELLRSRGYEIHLTKKSRDGGRDIIAKSDTGFGEPMTIAVEVKQKDVVGLADLQRTLKANENFPAIMLVTSGRFSAGVTREKSNPANHLRLLLKDGVALSQWISTYAAR